MTVPSQPAEPEQNVEVQDGGYVSGSAIFFTVCALSLLTFCDNDPDNDDIGRIGAGILLATGITFTILIIGLANAWN
jgi:hypothetical protein